MNNINDINKLKKLSSQYSKIVKENCKKEYLNLIKNNLLYDISPSGLIKLSKKSKKEQEIKIQEIVNNKIQFDYLQCQYNKYKVLQKKMFDLKLKILKNKKNINLNNQEQTDLNEFNKLLNTKNLSNIQIKKLNEYAIKFSFLFYKNITY